MKAILKFNLPEDKEEFESANKGSDWKFVVWDIDQWLRGQIKYFPDDAPSEKLEAYEECREKLRDLMYENNLNFH